MPSTGDRRAGIKIRIFILAFLLLNFKAQCQQGILDSLFSFNNGILKRSAAFSVLTRATGYYFTFDAKLINPEERTDLTFLNTPLRDILGKVAGNDSLRFSVINKYIILYRYADPVSADSSSAELPIKADRISGTVVDGESSEPLPFAAVGIINKGRGTVTNNNGVFELRITPDCLGDSLFISYLGYFNRKIPVMQAIGNDFTIKMTREYISIPEIIIKNQIPQEIIRKSYAAINKNYGSTPALMRAFYREAGIKKSALQVYSEAILDIYKSSYSSIVASDQVKVIKSRKIENTGIKDTLTVRLKAGLNSCLMLDGARNVFDFILPENYPQYTYRMTDIVTIDGESVYVVEFTQKENIEIPLYSGAVYINTENYAILRAEFELNPQYIHKSREDFVTYQAKGYRIWPSTMKYTVAYRKIGERYFLNHVRGDLSFLARQKSRLFSTTFNVFFELAVTDISLENVTRFERDEITPVHSIFSRQIDTYDREFWGDMDFLRPEENLLQALKNMNAKLQEFSKE